MKKRVGFDAVPTRRRETRSPSLVGLGWAEAYDGTVTPATPAKLGLTAAIAIPLLLFVSLVCWAFASPVGSSPDDNFHLSSIWCGLGDREGVCEPSGDPDTRMVPTPLVTATCYAFAPEESAACWNPHESGMSEATWTNAVGLYPPVFYAAMSLFVGDDVRTSVVVMRIVNSAFIVGLLSAVFFALPRRIRPALVVSALGSSVPLGLFVIASNNPSSWAFAAAAMVWVCLYGATQTTGRRQWTLGALAVVGAVVGAGARADAAAFAMFAIVIAAILGLRRGRPLLVPAVAAALVAAISIGFYLSAGQSGSLAAGLPTDNPPLTGSQHLANLFGVPVLWYGALGGWGLGWLDTAMPAAVPALAFGVYCAAIFVGIHRSTARRAVALTLAAAALWLVPFVLLAQSRAMIGTHVQPRYILPLLVILLGVATLASGIERAWRGPRALVAGACLSIAMSLALHDNIRRYTFGTERNAIDPGSGAEWWWAAGPSPLATWLLGSIAFAAVFVLMWLVLRRTDAVAAPDPADPDHAERDPAEIGPRSVDRERIVYDASR